MYRQTLAAVCTLLASLFQKNFSEQASRIIRSKLKENKRKSSLRPMAMPPVQGVLDRWDFYEKKASGNPQQDQRHVSQTNALNYNYLYYVRSHFKFYKSSSNDFAFQAPRCQESFRSTFPRAMPSSIRIPFKQLILLETVNTEHVQILSLMFISS